MKASHLELPVLEMARRVRAGDVTAESLAQASIDAIEAKRDLGAFLTVQRDQALETARLIDQRRARGETLGPLAGVPIGIKDALMTRGVPTTAASRILLHKLDGSPNPENGYLPPYDATTVARLRAADAVLVGKCNLDEFAMGSSTENSAFFPTKNPHDPTRIPGGSSGGSAVAVAAKMTAASLGSDTGGSIRQPAGHTGTVGVKPTYGRASRYGLIAFASSLDQVGVFANDVASAGAVLEIIAGHDPLDSTSLPGDLRGAFGGTPSLEGVRIGVPQEYFGEGIEPEVEARVREALAIAEAKGARIVPLSMPHTRYSVAVYYIIATAEASSNLARFDGVRYGFRADAASLGELYNETRARGFGPEVKRRIMLGTYVLSAGYYDAYYLRAQKVRTLIRRDFEQAFTEVDVLASPTSPTVAFPLGERTHDPLAMYLADVCTLPASLAGLPALSLPCGTARPPLVIAQPNANEGAQSLTQPELPVGLQLVAPPLGETRLFEVARAFEEALANRAR